MPFQSPGVYLEEVPAGSRPIEGVGTAVAAFVGLANLGPFNHPTLVTNWTQFTKTFGDFAEGSYLAHAVFGFFNNGGGKAYVVRVGEDGSPPSAHVELTSAADANLATYRFVARELGPAGNEVAIEIVDSSEETADDSFTVVLRRGTQEERYENVTSKPGAQNVVTVVNAASRLAQVEEIGGRVAAARRRPASGVYTLSGGTVPAVPSIGTDDYVGEVEQRTGFGSLEMIDEITMVCVPDLMAAYNSQAIDLDGVQAVQQAMIDHCTNLGDRMAILDSPPGLSPQQVKEWRSEKTNYDSAFATLYYPWVTVFDPVTKDNVNVPPCGHMAGIWSRTDEQRGVHKAPANEVVRGALDLETQVTKGEHDLLNPVGINVIRSFTGAGIRVWGARTLSSDTTWRYVNVRRLFNYLEESILEGTQWVVFEPNDMDLWGRIRRTVGAFLLTAWRDGALFGATPDQAFYVKCDEENNPSESIESGQVVCDIGIAAVKPAEFVFFRVAQLAAGAAVAE